MKHSVPCQEGRRGGDGGADGRDPEGAQRFGDRCVFDPGARGDRAAEGSGPARPAQKGVKSPFTGELQDRPAKPASVKVRVRALKNLKAMVSG